MFEPRSADDAPVALWFTRDALQAALGDWWFSPAGFAGLYATLGWLWILFSDRAVLALDLEPATLSLAQSYKGFAFVGLTAVLFFLLMRTGVRRLQHSADRAFRAESDLRRVLGASQAIIVLADEEGRIIGCNASATETVGGDAAGLLDRQLDSVFALPEAGRSGPCGLVDASAMGRPPRELVGLLTVLGDGRRLLVAQDETAQRRLELQLNRAMQVDLLAQLAGQIAHDFNNALTVVLGSVDLALHKVPDAHPSRPDLARIEAAASRGAQLARQLLSVGRRGSDSAARVSLAGALAGIGDMLEAALGPRVRASVLPPAPDMCVEVDADALERALLNLAVNARDAMPAGGTFSLGCRSVRVERAEAEDQGVAAGDFACIEARDTGCGMGPEVLAHAFDAFFTTKAADKGSGMGLAMVRGFARQARGFVTVDSAPGAGATFRIYLPLTGDDPVSPPRQTLA